MFLKVEAAGVTKKLKFRDEFKHIGRLRALLSELVLLSEGSIEISFKDLFGTTFLIEQQKDLDRFTALTRDQLFATLCIREKTLNDRSNSFLQISDLDFESIKSIENSLAEIKTFEWKPTKSTLEKSVTKDDLMSNKGLSGPCITQNARIENHQMWSNESSHSRIDANGELNEDSDTHFGILEADCQTSINYYKKMEKSRCEVSFQGLNSSTILKDSREINDSFDDESYHEHKVHISPILENRLKSIESQIGLLIEKFNQIIEHQKPVESHKFDMGVQADIEPSDLIGRCSNLRRTQMSAIDKSIDIHNVQKKIFQCPEPETETHIESIKIPKWDNLNPCQVKFAHFCPKVNYQPATITTRLCHHQLPTDKKCDNTEDTSTAIVFENQENNFWISPRKKRTSENPEKDPTQKNLIYDRLVKSFSRMRNEELHYRPLMHYLKE
jgi:hypothetical protein